MSKLLFAMLIAFTSQLWANDVDVNDLGFKYFGCQPYYDQEHQKCGKSVEAKSNVNHKIQSNDQGEFRVITTNNKVKVFGKAPGKVSEKLIGEIDLDFIRKRIEDRENLSQDEQSVETFKNVTSGYGALIGKGLSAGAMLKSAMGKKGTALTKALKVGGSAGAFFISSALFAPTDMKTGDNILRTILYNKRVNTPVVDPELTRKIAQQCVDEQENCFPPHNRGYRFTGVKKYRAFSNVDTSYQDLEDIFKVSLNEHLLAAIPHSIVNDFKATGRFIGSAASKATDVAIASGTELIKNIQSGLNTEKQAPEKSSAQSLD